MAQGGTTANRRPRSPRGEGKRLRVELLDAAAELMAQHGSLDKVSVRAVAHDVGVSPTAVYRHFDNHTDLLWASVQHCFDEFTRDILAAQASTDDPFDRLHATGQAYVRFATEHTGKYRVMFSNRVPLPEREQPASMTAFDVLVGLVADVLAARVDDRDPHFVAVQIWTWMHGIVDLIGAHKGQGMWPAVDDLLEDLRVRLELVPRL